MPTISTHSGEIYCRVDDFTDPWSTPETILLQHGALRSGAVWYGWVPHLAGAYRVLRPDMIGHGRSSEPAPGATWSIDARAKDIAELLDAMDVEKVHYVGESLGGATGIAFATTYPERVSSLTLISTPLDCTEPEIDQMHRHWRDLMVELGVRSAYMENMRARLPDEEAAMAGWLGDIISRASKEVALAIVDAVIPMNLTDRVAQISAPTLILAPERSHVLPLSHAKRAHSLISNSELRVFEGARHHLFLTRTLEAVECLKAFLSGLGGS